jgi:RimJ/RimL family protein N-acetyltransferase
MQAPTLRGEHVVLEALDLSHVDSLFANTADDEVWQHLTRPRPATPEGLEVQVREALRAQALGLRVAWAQRCARTGEVIGTTSFYDPNDAAHSIAIGYTMLGRPWWRTGVNTEAKLLLMARAFEELGAQRVEWHTDIRNERSQRAIERLGATREGVLRRHRQRVDGSWRDSVLYAMTAPEWPAARARLRESLRTPAPVG